MRITVALSAFLLLGAAEAAAQDTWIGAKYRAWRAGMEGDARTDESGIPGSKRSLDSDFGLDEEEIIHDVTVWGSLLGLGNARVNYWFGTFEGEGTVSSAFTWSGETFTAGSNIEIEYELTGISIMWDYPIAGGPLGMGSYEAALQAGYRYYSLLGDVSDGTKSGGGHVRAPILSAGARLFTRLASWLYAEVEAGIHIYSMNSDVDTRYWEVAVDLQISPFIEGVFIGAGYRRIELEVDDERRGSGASRDLDLVLDGFFVTVQLRF